MAVTKKVLFTKHSQQFPSLAKKMHIKTLCVASAAKNPDLNVTKSSTRVLSLQLIYCFFSIIHSSILTAVKPYFWLQSFNHKQLKTLNIENNLIEIINLLM